MLPADERECEEEEMEVDDAEADGSRSAPYPTSTGLLQDPETFVCASAHQVADVPAATEDIADVVTGALTGPPERYARTRAVLG